jgi:hypothetical protein
MKLPNADRLEVPRAKVADYLLSPSHPQGRHKAAFFNALGFSHSDWQTLAEALRRHGAESEVTTAEDTPFGRRYVVRAELIAPDGRRPRLRSIWYIGGGEDVPRFVTAFPAPRRTP